MMKKDISKLHYITQDIEGVSHAELAEQACISGAKWIQLRVKDKLFDEWLDIARQTQIVCNRYKAKLIINDNVQIAHQIQADGIHLGKRDISPIEARKILGREIIIGGSANTMNDIVRLYACEVDYIGIGPYRFTSTKKDLNTVLGLNGINNIIKMIDFIKLNNHYSIPLIAIGGIVCEDVESLKNNGIYGVAVSGFITNSKDKKKVIEDFNLKLNA